MPSHQRISPHLHGRGNQILRMPAVAAAAGPRTFTRNLFYACRRLLPAIGKLRKGAIPRGLTTRGLTMSVLALDRTVADRAGGDSAAKAWLRALAATAPIAAQPGRTLAA